MPVASSRYAVAAAVGFAALVVGLDRAADLGLGAIAESLGHCDYAPCIDGSALPKMAAFIITALFGVALLLFAGRRAAADPRLAVTTARLIAVIGSVLLVTSVVSGYGPIVFTRGVDEAGAPLVLGALALVVGTVALIQRVPEIWVGTVMLGGSTLGFLAGLQWGFYRFNYAALALWLVAFLLLLDNRILSRARLDG